MFLDFQLEGSMATTGNQGYEASAVFVNNAQRSVRDDIPISMGATPASTNVVAEATLGFQSKAWSLIDNSQRVQLRLYEGLKRAIDAVGAVLLLIATMPLFLTISTLIKITSPGPVLFSQIRLGRYGREFRCYKFRSMVVGADAMLEGDPNLWDEFRANYKLRSDPRVTCVGNFLRCSSWDELPQLWNVLRGDMSLIGPRPIVPLEIGKYGVYGRKLLEITPGLSGLWQACGRSDTTYDERIQLDMLYIDHRSTFLDLKLMLSTVIAVFRKLGAC
jgi:lipopolysaccharide/colanic/teichoic acid biosynthesis glycosyltransferase